MNIAFGRLIIYAAPSENGPWAPVLPDAVPGWVKDFDTLGNLVANPGLSAHQEGEPSWYRVEQVRIIEPAVSVIH